MEIVRHVMDRLTIIATYALIENVFRVLTIPSALQENVHHQEMQSGAIMNAYAKKDLSDQEMT
jgi:hypothetical protein